MATFEQEWEERFKKLEERHERGEISYEELIKRGNASYEEMRISSGQLAAANTSGSGCVVLALVGGVIPVVAVAVEILMRMMG
jgi:hypothetical protein